jgi:hypothetical protein
MSFWGYESSIKRRLFFVVSYYLIALFVDVVMYLGLKNLLYGNQVKAITADSRFTIIYNIIFLMVTRIISLIVKDKEKREIKMGDWIEVFFVPLGSIFLVIWCFGYKTGNNATFDFIGLVIILLMNVISYFTYVAMEEKAQMQYRSGLLEIQNRCYVEETKRITSLWGKISSFEHDNKYYFSHLVDNNSNQTNCVANFGNIVATSGNFVIDSIINNRATITQTEHIDFRVDLRIPMDLEFYEDDLSILLCNLIDNAIEANSYVTDNPWIDISISTDTRNESTLLITISNPYNGGLKKNGKGEYVTRKEDKKHHGIGLQSVKNLVKKHGGEIIISEENDIFKVDIIMFDMIKPTKVTV